MSASAWTWVGLLAGGVLAGAGACAALVLPRGRDIIATAIAVASLATAVVSLVSIGRATGRVDTTIVAGFIATASGFGGFALAAALLPVWTSPRPFVTSPGIGADNRRIAVVMLAEGEPDSYDPSVVTAGFLDLEETGVPVPIEAARTLLYFSEKSRYTSVGAASGRTSATSVADKLSLLLTPEIPNIDVHVAWLDPPDRLDSVMAEAVVEGYRRIAVVPFGIADSMHLDRAKVSVDALAPNAGGVRVAYAAPLWGNSIIARAVADQVLASVPAMDRATTGVVLVGHGQPWQWDRTHPAGSEQETYFAQRVRALLLEEGFGPGMVRLGWLDWQDQGVSEAVRHLVAFGCQRVIVVPAAMPFETLGTLIDLRGAAEEATLGTKVTLEVLPTWGDQPSVISALADAARSAIRELPES